MFIYISPNCKTFNTTSCISIHGNRKEVLYLGWNERHLRLCFETLMALLAAFLYKADLVINIC